MKKRLSIVIIALSVLVFGINTILSYRKTDSVAKPPESSDVVSQIDSAITTSSEIDSKEKVKQLFIQRQEIPKERISMRGPRDGVPDDTPKGDGFWSFGIPIPGVLSRSGQPKIKHYQWLKEQGTKSVINLREPGEYGEKAKDTQIKGFEELGFQYLQIPIKDGAAPTSKQAEQFLDFITRPENQPAHIHCRGGYGRTGTFVALYRYVVQGWPLDSAIKESRLYNGGISKAQESWLRKWIKQQEESIKSES